ncbi:hypothetical protein LCGC14_1626770 [marine sediment metagenome]|uniref:DUF4355 domain-containing protein n=1 Tax=marine sediment metagenome TaxID=412755 RepID=A0A0F9IQU8_9ZZZZ
MGETKEEPKGTPPPVGQSSEEKKGSTSPTEATYTKVQLEKYKSDGLAEQGRTHKTEVNTLRQERDRLSDVKDDREALQKQIDEMKSTDPEVYSLAKKEQELRERETQLTKGVREHKERITRAESFEREISIQRIVEEYEGADFGKLKVLCETLDNSSEEQIRKVADTLWGKKFNPPASETPSVSPAISGMTSGGEETPTSARGKMKAGWDERHKK